VGEEEAAQTPRAVQADANRAQIWARLRLHGQASENASGRWVGFLQHPVKNGPNRTAAGDALITWHDSSSSKWDPLFLEERSEDQTYI
jgi:hypothetical protein